MFIQPILTTHIIYLQASIPGISGVSAQLYQAYKELNAGKNRFVKYR